MMMVTVSVAATVVTKQEEHLTGKSNPFCPSANINESIPVKLSGLGKMTEATKPKQKS